MIVSHSYTAIFCLNLGCCLPKSLPMHHSVTCGHQSDYVNTSIDGRQLLTPPEKLWCFNQKLLLNILDPICRQGKFGNDYRMDCLTQHNDNHCVAQPPE